MTVKGLIAQLKQCDGDLEVVFSYDYGYWGSTVTEEVESLEESSVTWSDYHRSYKLVSEDEEAWDELDDEQDGNEAQEDRKFVLVLHGKK